MRRQDAIDVPENPIQARTAGGLQGLVVEVRRLVRPVRYVNMRMRDVYQMAKSQQLASIYSLIRAELAVFEFRSRGFGGCAQLCHGSARSPAE